MVTKSKTGQVVLNIVFIILAVWAVAPFLLLISSSLSSEAALAKYGYGFWPREFSLNAYTYLFKSSIQRRILKCVSLRFVNYADMIETLLRTITNRGIWKFIWLPHISTITLRSNEPLTYDTNFPLSHDSLLIRGFDRRYQIGRASCRERV